MHSSVASSACRQWGVLQADSQAHEHGSSEARQLRAPKDAGAASSIAGASPTGWPPSLGWPPLTHQRDAGKDIADAAEAVALPGRVGGLEIVQHRSKVRKSETTGCTGAGESFAAGIDLGTSNSVIAVLRNGRPVTVPLQGGGNTLPSIVTVREDGSVEVGADAKRQVTTAPLNTFYSVKRFMGRNFASAKRNVEKVAYSVGADQQGRVKLLCRHVDGGSLYPEEVSQHIVRALLSAAEAFTGTHVERAVISVPAYFDAAQRRATVFAGQMAGLKTVRLIREPVAAALAYGVSVVEDASILVLDLGGGTFDVSILEIGGGVIEVLSTGGDPFLGGDDFDALIVEWLLKNHLKGINTRDPHLIATLRATAEAAKVRLSRAPEVALRLPVGAGLTATLTRETLEALATPLFRAAREPIDVACWQAGVDLETELAAAARRAAARAARGRSAAARRPAGVELRPKRRAPISQVLLVGGATRMPAFRRFVRNMTGLAPSIGIVDPDEAVALGAAVQAGRLEGHMGNVMVMDVWQAALMRGLAENALKKNPSLADTLGTQQGQGRPEGVLQGIADEAEGYENENDDDDEDDEDWGPHDHDAAHAL